MRLLTSDLNKVNMVVALRSRNTERIQEDILLASSTIMEMCSDQLMYAVMVTPRSRTALAGEKYKSLTGERYKTLTGRGTQHWLIRGIKH